MQLKSLLPIFLLFIGSNARSQIINTIAGTPTMPGYSGDGGLAVAATLSTLPQACPDYAGNVYIADCTNNRIRKVNTAGIITTIAGNGTPGYSGDGGQATSAELNYPRGIAVDKFGNIYFCDTRNAVIRKITIDGIITTIAGNGSSTYSGDGGAATAAGISPNNDIVIDTAENIYISDLDNSRVRKINTSGIILTIAGNGTPGDSGDGGLATAAKLNSPDGLAVDNMENVYIADFTNNDVRKVDATGIITTVAGIGTAGYSGDGGQATAAELNSPGLVAIDQAGNIYIADALNSCIRKVNTGGIITTIAGIYHSPGFSGDGGPAIDAQLDGPSALTVDGGGNIYISDGRIFTVRKITVPFTGITSPQPFGKDALSIWPNPNDGNFFVHLLSVSGSHAKIIITNILGEKVKEYTITTNQEATIQLDAPAGMYFLTAVIGEGMQCWKLEVR